MSFHTDSFPAGSPKNKKSAPLAAGDDRLVREALHKTIENILTFLHCLASAFPVFPWLQFCTAGNRLQITVADPFVICTRLFFSYSVLLPN